MNLLQQVKLTLFFNNYRGLSVLKFLKKKKLNIQNIIISKENLNKFVLIHLRKKKIKFFLIKNLKERRIVKILRNTDLGLVCGFSHIFKKELINLTKYGLLNCHAGKLPEYRGGSPLNWQIINNEKYFGISVIKINKDIDKGDIVKEKKFKLYTKYTIKDLHKIANNNFPILIYKSIIKILLNRRLKKQNNRLAKYYKQRRPEDSFIDFKITKIYKVKLLIRALQDPYPNPYFFYRDNNFSYFT